MSAFVVSKLTIDVLVSALDEFKIRHELGRDPRAIGQALWRENVESVTYRYGLKNRDDDRAGELAQYEAMIEAYEPRELTAMKAGGVLKVAHCFDYQACEHDGWETSKAKAALDSLAEALGRKLPGYEDGPWGISSEADLEKVCIPQAISLTSLMARRKAR